LEFCSSYFKEWSYVTQLKWGSTKAFVCLLVYYVHLSPRIEIELDPYFVSVYNHLLQAT
jgi:hypothetical protein